MMTMDVGAGHGGSASGGSGNRMSAGDPEEMLAEMEERLKEAEANRRVVEYRMFYSDYKAFDGVKFPTRIQRMMTNGVATGPRSVPSNPLASKPASAL